MIVDEEVYLEHHGVKGMHWGTRKKRDIPRHTERIARKDAQETAKTMFSLGKNADFQRTAISKVVQARKSNDPAYAKAFNKHMADQPLSKLAKKSAKEQSKIDLKNAKEQSKIDAQRAKQQAKINEKFAAERAKREAKQADLERRNSSLLHQPETKAVIAAAVVAGAVILAKKHNQNLMQKPFKGVVNTTSGLAKVFSLMKSKGITPSSAAKVVTPSTAKKVYNAGKFMKG